MKKFLKIILIIIFFIISFFIIEDPVNQYFEDKKTIEKLVNDVNSLIDNPQDKIEPNDILWIRNYNYVTNGEEFLPNDKKREIPADEDKTIDHTIYYIQLNEYSRSEMTDNAGSDYAENRKMLLNFSYDYLFGNGYYIYYSTPTTYRMDTQLDIYITRGVTNYYKGFYDKNILPSGLYKLEQNLFTRSRNEDEPIPGIKIIGVGNAKLKTNIIEKYDVFDPQLHSLIDGQNFQNIMMKWDQKLNENIIELVKEDAEDLKDFQLTLSLLDVGGSSSCSSISDGDWAYPNFDDATAAFKFNSDYTFNYSNTYTNTTRYGTWKIIDNCSYQLKFRNGDMKTVYISGDSFNIGSTKYKKY